MLVPQMWTTHPSLHSKRYWGGPCPGGHWFKPRLDQHLKTLNNSGGSAAFLIGSLRNEDDDGYEDFI